MARHLDQLDVPGGRGHLPRGEVDVVVTAEIAGVVIRDFATLAPPSGFATDPLRSSSAKHLGVVNDLVVPAQLGIFVGQGVEAMRALGDDLLDPEAVERLDVREGQLLPQVLVAGPAGGIAVAGSRAGPRMAKSIPAWCSKPGERHGEPRCCGRHRSLRNRRTTDTRHARCSRQEPAPRSRAVRSKPPAAHGSIPHGLPWFSMATKALESSAGKLDSIIVR